MKHLPNLLTLANLFCGCIAIVFILNSQPYLADINTDTTYWVYGTEQAYWGAIFICIAAVCDLFDGLVARSLKIFSPIGMDLDSLADVVSFGVAPSMILFKMLWGSYMRQPDAMDAPMLAMTPAFLIACFAALRLARYNTIASTQQNSFTGLPVPAVGLFVASFPLINWYNPYGIGVQLQSKWSIYIVIAVLCWLMVSHIRFMKMIPARWNMATAWPQILLIVATAIGIAILKVGAIPFAFLLYVVLSLVSKSKQEEVAAA